MFCFSFTTVAQFVGRNADTVGLGVIVLEPTSFLVQLRSSPGHKTILNWLATDHTVLTTNKQQTIKKQKQKNKSNAHLQCRPYSFATFSPPHSNSSFSSSPPSFIINTVFFSFFFQAHKRLPAGRIQHGQRLSRRFSRNDKYGGHSLGAISHFGSSHRTPKRIHHGIGVSERVTRIDTREPLAEKNYVKREEVCSCHLQSL